MWHISNVVDLKDVAPVARKDHVVSKCAHSVERNPAVIHFAPGAGDRRKEREGTRWRGPKDTLAKCEEDVARGEPSIHGLRWR
jgi:hypothetical protein